MNINVAIHLFHREIQVDPRHTTKVNSLQQEYHLRIHFLFLQLLSITLLFSPIKYRMTGCSMDYPPVPEQKELYCSCWEYVYKPIAYYLVTIQDKYHYPYWFQQSLQLLYSLYIHPVSYTHLRAHETP